MGDSLLVRIAVSTMLLFVLLPQSTLAVKCTLWTQHFDLEGESPHGLNNLGGSILVKIPVVNTNIKGYTLFKDCAYIPKFSLNSFTARCDDQSTVITSVRCDKEVEVNDTPYLKFIVYP